MSRSTATPESGSALVAALFIVMVLLGMSSALLSTSFFRQSAARAATARERAYENALTGLAVALFEIRQDLDTGGDGVGAASGSLAGGAYRITISPVFAGPGEYTLTASGSCGGVSQAMEVVVAPESAVGFGLFGRDGISMSGSFSVDSYDSTLGSYASQVGVDHAGDEGHIASNGNIVAGGGIIHGNATPGPGFTVSSPGNVTGATAPAAEPVTMPPYVYSPPIASMGIWSGTGTISTGTYRYTTLTLSGGSILTISGDVTLYVDDKFTASGSSIIDVLPGGSLTIHHGANDFTVSGGGIVNRDQDPSKMTLYSASLKKFTLSGGSDFHGLVYAPETQFVASGGSDLYGVIVARTATLSAAGHLHFDTSLGTGSGSAGFVVKAGHRVRAP